MKTKLISLCLSLLLVCTVTGQVKVSGSIVDAETKEPIEFASLALLKTDSTFVIGTSSDEQGMFTFDNTPADNYILSATYVGYKNLYLPISNQEGDIDLGVIAMDMTDIELQGVTVTASAVIQKADRKLIIPSQAQIKASNSGVTLLRNLQLSRIIVNPLLNSISVPGGDAVQLRINGVEVTMQEVIALQPADVIRIEYHDEPGMRYGGAAAVIDYIVRRKESGGNISANLANVPYDKLGWGENVFAAKYNNRKSEFGVNAYWSRRSIDWVRENTETFVFPDKSLTRTEEGQPTRYKEDNLNVSLNYNLNEPDKYMFNARLRTYYQYEPNVFTDRNSTIYSSDNTSPLSVSDHSTWRSNTPSLDLYYQRNLKNNQLLIFNAVGTYINSRSTRLYQESRNSELFTDIYSGVDGDKYSFIGEGIYEKTFESGKLSVGMKHTQSYTSNVYSGDVQTAVDLKVAETYGYAEYRFNKKKFNYTLGLGMMRTYNSQGGENNEKYIFRPTLRIGYNVNDNIYIRYNGYISGYSPSLSDLNNVEQEIDSLQIRRGNPNLNTVMFHSHTINAGYNKGKIGVEFYFRYSYDHKPIMEQISYENGKFIRTNINQKGFHRIYAETSFRLKPWKDYISLSVTPGMNRFISYGDDFTHTYTAWRVRASLTANYKNWVLMGEVYTRWKSFWGETLNIGERMHVIGAGYNTEKWSLTAMMLNPFSRSYSIGTRSYSKLVPNVSDVYSDNLAQIIAVNFTFNLNFGRKYNAADKRINNDDSDAGIMSGTKK